MRIAVDATPLTARGMTGTGRYILALLAGLARKEEGKGTLVVVSDPGACDRLEADHPFSIHLLRWHGWLGPLTREYGRQSDLRALCRRERIDVLHTTLDPVWPMRRTRQVITVHDVARSSAKARGLSVNTPRERIRTGIRYRLARRADRIMTVSAFSRRQITDVLGVDEARVSAVHTGLTGVFARPVDAAETDAVIARHGIQRGYVLFVGQFGRQKNEQGVIEACRRLHKRGRPAELILVGDGLLRQVGDGEARVLRRVPDEELVHLYAGAGAFCLPSFYEGFGFPAVEAMARGLPVVVSRGTCLEEIADRAGILVDPSDPDSIADGLAEALDDADRGIWRARSIERASWFTPERMGDGVVGAYREVLGG